MIRDTKDFEKALKLVTENDGFEPTVSVCALIASALHEARCEGFREGVDHARIRAPENDVAKG